MYSVTFTFVNSLHVSLAITTETTAFCSQTARCMSVDMMFCATEEEESSYSNTIYRKIAKLKTFITLKPLKFIVKS